MTLESSEVQNCSWRIRTKLKSFLASSSSCHAAPPLYIRPMMSEYKMILKMIFYSPENNRSIIFSGKTSMTKKMNQFLWHWKIGTRIILWFNICPSSFPNRYSSWGWAGRKTSLWFCFGLWSACKSKYIRFQRKVFELHFWSFLLVVVLLLVVQVRDQLTQAMRNSDTRVRMVLVQRLKSDSHSIFIL